jgi:hypothetical protein
MLHMLRWCFKCMFQMFHLLQIYVASVLSKCCKNRSGFAYTCMLQTYVLSIYRCFICSFASVSWGCCICLQLFSNVFQTFIHVFQTLLSSISFVFFRMLQLLHLDVSKIDRVLHMGCTCGKRVTAWATFGVA